METAKLKTMVGRQVRIAARPQHSSIHARTFAGQVGRLYGMYKDPQDGQVLGAIVGLRAVTWVDSRDLEEVKGC